MLKEGQKAPDFSLPDVDMRQVKSADFRGEKNLVLFFYPRTGASSCSIVAIEFTEMIQEFQAEKTAVIGINMEDCGCHAAFRDRYDLAVGLLSDESGELCKAFGVWREATAGGERTNVLPCTFIIDREGVIRHVLHDVKPVGHAAQVLELIRSMDEPQEAA
ncbi:MAG TPA: peroxiredoxin [Sedimenticola sp.]|nr:peroxiredoxin [Sedimenticola sp.]